ncbi:MAG TPA: hypothetical protein VMB48_05855 [Steroidobacteraceae bacterium]|nr:hypothetical protein [Steroidobacteraceae bacterium]
MRTSWLALTGAAACAIAQAAVTTTAAATAPSNGGTATAARAAPPAGDAVANTAFTASITIVSAAAQAAGSSAGAAPATAPHAASARSAAAYRPAIIRLSAAALEQLHATDPARYASVHSILTSAAQLCSPGAPALQSIGDAHDAGCEPSLWKTGSTPRRELRFTIGGTFYYAEVTADTAAAFAAAPPAPVRPGSAQ